MFDSDNGARATLEISRRLSAVQAELWQSGEYL